METKQGYFDGKLPRPLDDRFYKATQADILAIPIGARYKGMEIYAYDDEEWYWFKDGVQDGDLEVSPRGGTATINNGIGTEFNVAGEKVDLGGGEEVTGQRTVNIAPGSGSTNQFNIYAAFGQVVSKVLQFQQNIMSFFGRQTDDTFAGMGIEDANAGNFNGQGQIAGFYAKQFGASNNGFGAGIYAERQGELTVWPGALRSKMLNFKYLADYPDIDWATDLAGAGVYIPHQKRVQDMINASGGGGGPDFKAWYVDDSQLVTGDGSSANPFKTITEAVSAASDGDTIYIAVGSYNENPPLDKNLNFIGAGTDRTGLTGVKTSWTINNPTIGDVSSSKEIRFVGMQIAAVNWSIDNQPVTFYFHHCHNSGFIVGSPMNTIHIEHSYFSGDVIAANTMFISASTINGNVETQISNLTLENSTILGNATSGNDLTQNNTVVTGTVTASGTLTVNNQGGGGASFHDYRILYVDLDNGSDSNGGGLGDPVQTIAQAFALRDALVAEDFVGIEVRGSGVLGTENVPSGNLETALVFNQNAFLDTGKSSEIIITDRDKLHIYNLGKEDLIDPDVTINQTSSSVTIYFYNCIANVREGTITTPSSCDFYSFNCADITFDGDYGDIFATESNVTVGGPSAARVNINGGQVNFNSDITISGTSTWEKCFVKIGNGDTVTYSGTLNDEGVGFLFEGTGTLNVTGTRNTITGEWAQGGGGGAPLETEQEVTITDGNRTSGLALDADANRIKVILDATLTGSWQPATITGWVEHRSYLFVFVKNVEQSVDMSVARTAVNVGYDDDINPFLVLDSIDTTQKRAIIPATGFKSTFGQFGRMIITDTNYVE